MSFFKRFHYNSPVILTYTLLSLFALLLAYATNGVSTTMLFSVYKGSFTDPLFYVRMFGHVLGHQDLTHFVNNFIIILLIGPILEEKYGSLKILIVILITALLTGVINVIFFDTMLLGASGVAFALIVLSSFVNLQKGRIPITFLLVVGIFIGKEVLNGVYSADSISQLTHIVGGICGGLIGYFLNKKDTQKPEEILDEITDKSAEKIEEKIEE